jgi:hypothetical protein
MTTDATRRPAVVALLIIAALGLVGCTATPAGMAVHLAGQAVNDIDVSRKSDELIGVSSAKCDEALGQPMETYRSEAPLREWRVYAVKNDLLDKYRYLVETTGGRVVSISKADPTAIWWSTRRPMPTSRSGAWATPPPPVRPM